MLRVHLIHLLQDKHLQGRNLSNNVSIEDNQLMGDNVRNQHQNAVYPYGNTQKIIHIITISTRLISQRFYFLRNLNNFYLIKTQNYIQM
jgi:hypothetical protein